MYQKVKRIIDYAIIPLVEQYFFGKKENVEEIKRISNACVNRLSGSSSEGEEEKPLFRFFRIIYILIIMMCMTEIKK